MKKFIDLFRRKKKNEFTGFRIQFYLNGKLMTENMSNVNHYFYYDIPQMIKLSEKQCLAGYELKPNVISTF